MSAMSTAILVDSSGNVEVDYPPKVWSVSLCLNYSCIAVIEHSDQGNL